MKNIEAVKKALETICAANNRSAWNRGVNEYAREILEEIAENINDGYISADVFETRAALKKAALNGAEDWTEYSYGGSALINDCDIAERLCTPSELRKTCDGLHDPNSRETWLDVQPARCGTHLIGLTTPQGKRRNNPPDETRTATGRNGL